jgi:hypothetical protein
MTIELWAKRSIKGPYEIFGSSLYVYLHKGRAFAGRTYTSDPKTRTPMIPVSDELAFSVLGAERRICPHTGTSPTRGIMKFSGYTIRGSNVRTTRDREGKIIENCTVCGYRISYPGFLPVNSSFFNDPDIPISHPPVECLYSEKPYAAFTYASWDPDMFGFTTYSDGDGKLILWLCGRHFKSGTALAACRNHFPDAEMLMNGGYYYILRDGAQNKFQYIHPS